MSTSERPTELRKSFQLFDKNTGPRTGTPVKVRGGAFRGHTGFIEERRPNRLALVWIEVLGQLVRVEIDPYHLDVLN